jgi:UDP-glucose 4-epimerase
MSKRCLVTGGAGFIGSHLVEGLLKQGWTVRVLDDLSTGHADNLAPMMADVELHQGNICDSDSVAKAVQGVEVVFHLAAMASVAKSLENPLLCHQICGTGTLSVLDAARRAGVKRVVYAASSSAYGRAMNPEGLSEETPLCPLSPYAAAKLVGEHYLEAFTHSFGLETVRLRFFNIFGPRQRADSPYSGVIAIFAGLMSQGRTPVVHGDGLQTRDFVYVADAVQSLIKGAEVPGASGQVYNVGTGRSITLLDLVSTLNTVLGTSFVPEHGPARQGDVRFSLAKIDKITQELGYKPTVDLEEGLRRTVAWANGASL